MATPESSAEVLAFRPSEGRSGASTNRSILTLIEGRPAIVLDPWRRLDDGEPLPELRAEPLSEWGPILLSRTRFEALRAAQDRSSQLSGLRLGVSVAGDADFDEVCALASESPGSLAPELIAIEVPKFTDGRHYSLARMLRERAGFKGELRAFGDVLPDQLFYMRRCGYTAFELKAGKSLETGLRSLETFSVRYQAGAEQQMPLYRRRG